VQGERCCGQPVLELCECGDNWVCLVCHNGYGQMPCHCKPLPPMPFILPEEHVRLLNQNIHDHADLWRRLADR
jgi:hypothetical protein